MSTSLKQLLRSVSVLSAFVASVATAANLAPAVNAGSDAEYPSGQSLIYLEGTVQDDATPLDSLVIRWRQVAGPAQAEILDSTSLITLVTFPQIGTYTFLLFASDGALGAIDSVNVKIRESLPFKVLAPVQDQEVQIGQSFTVRWQREPKIPCQVYYSIDEGLTKVEITATGAVASGAVTWQVSDTLTAGTPGIVIVQVYQKPDDNTTGSFILVDHPPQSTRTRHSSRIPGPYSIGILPGGRVRVDGPTPIGTVNLSICDSRGRTVTAATTDIRLPWDITAPGTGASFYMISVNGKRIQSGTLGSVCR